jgi:hypothetical protein
MSQAFRTTAAVLFNAKTVESAFTSVYDTVDVMEDQGVEVRETEGG